MTRESDTEKVAAGVPAPPTVSENNPTMSTKNVTGQKESGPNPRIESESASDSLPLGVDGEGATHHYSRIRQEIIVEADDGTIERRVDIQDRRLSAWIAYVDDRRTWDVLNYRESFADVLKEALK